MSIETNKLLKDGIVVAVLILIAFTFLKISAGFIIKPIGNSFDKIATSIDNNTDAIKAHTAYIKAHDAKVEAEIKAENARLEEGYPEKVYDYVKGEGGQNGKE
jgi:F0F1-type ATP synthase membrane subunit b/b'